MVLPNTYFQFKQFTVHHDRCAMKVTTDACLFGAWSAEEMKNEKGKIQNALDIGAGTGLLPLMVVQKNEVAIDAVEIDGEAVQQAKENVAASPWSDRITIFHADATTWQADKMYNCIFSNPPFYESELRSANKSKNVAHHDEGLKLEGLFTFIKSHLAENGVFFLLLPAKRENEMNDLLKRFSFHLHQKIFVRQTVNHTPFRLMIQAGNKKEQEIILRDLSIKNENNEYTTEFIVLLKDYYLHL